MQINSIRLVTFIGTFLVLVLLEVFFSYRKRSLPRSSRWPANISLIVISNLLVKAFLPLGLASLALFFKKQSWGLFNLVELNFYLEVLISIVLLDLVIYFQHVLSHKINFIWRFHRVHHADVDLDVTSALRFHPIEIIFSIGYKIAFIFFLGVKPEAIIAFEIILSTMAMFNHSNLYLPVKLEKCLRYFIVTPQMHLIHHSIDQRESDMNYGFNLSFWDRLFGTYQAKFITEGKIGQNYYREKKKHRIKDILVLPFISVDNK